MCCGSFGPGGSEEAVTVTRTQLAEYIRSQLSAIEMLFKAKNTSYGDDANAKKHKKITPTGA